MKMNRSMDDAGKLCMGAVLFLALAYTAVRAWRISIFHDEAYSIIDAIRCPLSQTLRFDTWSPANNHLLNTLLMEGLYRIFGFSEFALRVPALMGHVLYLTAVVRILNLLGGGWLKVAGLVLMALSPFMLELFSAARGYSLGLGFWAWALYYYLRILRGETDEETRRMDVLRLSGLMVLAILSYLVFIQVYTAFLAILFLWEIFSLGRPIPGGSWGGTVKKFWHNFLLLIVPSVIFLVSFLAEPVLRMAGRNDQFIEGGTAGFWADTVPSLVRAVLYEHHSSWGPLLWGLIAFVLGTTVALAVRALISRRVLTPGERSLIAVFALVVVAATVVVIQHHVTGSLFLTQRRGAYFIPLFLLLLICLLQQMSSARSQWLSMLGHGFGIALAFLTLAHFVSAANVSHFYICRYDASTKEMMRDLAAMNAGKNLQDSALSIGNDWSLTPGLYFYKAKYRMEWLKWPAWGDPDGPFDYYYLISGDQSGLWEHRKRDTVILNKYHLTVIKEFPLAGTTLAAPAK
ncbi:MAG: hypothetical protein Q8Q08_00860 [Candidatus Omnitrophota bacterium]|nr:hypothetical protein [Candidatus Omnitrophota bacterium]MDZ4242302.1 hypothetical protein [Candidatus Omnitrophota bacterium]